MSGAGHGKISISRQRNAMWAREWKGKVVKCLCDNAAVVEIVRSGQSNTVFILCSQTVLVRYGTVRYGKTDVCKQRFIAPYRTVPISASTLGAAGLMRYASVRYVKIFACKH